MNALARRRRLGAALLQLREEQHLTHTQLAAKSDTSGTAISRLENPIGNVSRKPNLLVVRRLLDALGLARGSKERDAIEQFAEDGSTRGWWESGPYAAMGERQRRFAGVEQDAATIDEYAAFLLPGLVQTETFAAHRATVGAGVDGPAVDAIVAGRLRRQRQITGQDGAEYRLVLEEQTIRRDPVPRPVMVNQLRHLLDLMDRPNVSVRVVEVSAPTGAVPRSPFAHISYPDRDDPEIVTVDTVTADLMVTEAGEVAGYAQLHQRLRDAALSGAESAALIREVADSLAATI